MIVRLAALAFLSFMSAPALAENIRVRSGEHEDFSRIVLVFGSPVSWSERTTDKGFEIRFDRKNLTLDLSRVFDLIPRDRIESISFDTPTGTLFLGSQCGCTMEAFLAGKNTLAIDVADAAKNDLRQEVAAKSAIVFPFGVPKSVLDQNSISLPPGASLEPGVADVELDDSDDEDAVQPVRPDRASLEEALMLQLGRAASQGLADVELPDRLEETGEQLEPSSVDTSEGRHISTETVFDRVGWALEAEPVSPVADERCLESALLDPEQWTGESLDTPLIGPARLQLLDQRDQPDSGAVERLVQTYLFLGFGAEALAVVNEFPDSLEHAAVYRSVSMLLDDRSLDSPSPLDGQEHCDGSSVVWAVFGSRDPLQLKDIDPTVVQDWFFRFPPTLRTQLGPTLARNLLDAGLADAAASVRNATERSAARKSSELVLLDATTGLAPRQRREANEALKDLVERNDETSAPALNELLRKAIRGGIIDPDQVELAEAMAKEQNGSPIADDLLRTAAVARAHLGDWEMALQHFRKMKVKGRLSETIDELRSEIVDRMVLLEDDVALLRYVQGADKELLSEPLPTGTLHNVIGRLIVLGLWKPAERLLETDNEDDSFEHRQLTARVALMRGDPSLALTLLAGKSDPASLDIRARALSALGEHVSAADLFSDMGDRDGARRQAWLSGDKTLIDALGSDEQRAFGAVRRSGTEPVFADVEQYPVTLATAREAVARSERMRQQLELLMETGNLVRNGGGE